MTRFAAQNLLQTRISRSDSQHSTIIPTGEAATAGCRCHRRESRLNITFPFRSIVLRTGKEKVQSRKIGRRTSVPKWLEKL